MPTDDFSPAYLLGYCTPESIALWLAGKQEEPTISFPDSDDDQ